MLNYRQRFADALLSAKMLLCPWPSGHINECIPPAAHGYQARYTVWKGWGSTVGTAQASQHRTCILCCPQLPLRLALKPFSQTTVQTRQPSKATSKNHHQLPWSRNISELAPAPTAPAPAPQVNHTQRAKRPCNCPGDASVQSHTAS